ncbi:hypothetical protein Tco_1221719 [Tanacetum coccineum]
MQKTSTEPLQTEDEPLDQKFSGHVANPMPYLSGSQTGSHDRTIFNNDRPIFRVPPGFDTSLNQEVACSDNSGDIDQICDENVQLFMRCEQYMQREKELRTTVEDLEKQVADTKRKSVELSSHIELLRRKKLLLR